MMLHAERARRKAALRRRMAAVEALLQQVGRPATGSELAAAFADLPAATGRTLLGRLVRRGWLQRAERRRGDTRPRYVVGEQWRRGGDLHAGRDPMRHALHLLGVSLALEHRLHAHDGPRARRTAQRAAENARRLAVATLASVALPPSLFRWQPAGGAA